MTEPTYRIKALECCAKKPEPFNCPCCSSAPVINVRPPDRGWEKLGPMRRLECPRGCFKTRRYWFGKEVKAWNIRVAQIANMMKKSERGQRIKQTLEECNGLKF